MKVLVLGSGAREHAIAWKLKQSPLCEKVYLHPGNAGTKKFGFTPLELEIQNIEQISVKAKMLGIELAVIGPENLLAEGYADHLRKEGFLVVGPSQTAARLETSKVFAKEFMKRAEIPTADFSVVSSKTALENHRFDSWPTVLKLDGLAAGKGVVIATNAFEVKEFAERIWEIKEFGPGPHQVVIEEFIPGLEISYMGFCDGMTFIPLATATDYKRISDQDLGPNTGGMGAVSPSPFIDPSLQKTIDTEIISHVLAQLKKENLPFRGILYIGLMITKNGRPYVLEFNTRFGDPETQAILMRLKSDLLPLFIATAKGTLSEMTQPEWVKETSVYVVAATEGYPANPQKGDIIKGLENIPLSATLFFSGVEQKEESLVTNGGRVLGVGALGSDLKKARDLAYDGLQSIHWRGMHFRKDIGLINKEKAL